MVGKKDWRLREVDMLKWICSLQLKNPPANKGPRKASVYQSDGACACAQPSPVSVAQG